MPSEPIVETVSGKVRGSTQAGIRAFKGIPYGASTSGANRFQPPRPPEPWAGMRDALALGGRAPQWQGAPTRRPGMANFLGPVDTSPETEDCLNLHVWTPGLDGSKRPVMVWLHGGAFHFGSANRAVTDGANLARRGDVVVVAVNHRLNILGHLDLVGDRRRALCAFRQCRRPRSRRRARMGARQYRAVRRRSRQCHDFRRVGRRRQSQRAARDAESARAVPPRRHPERRVGPRLDPRARRGARRGGLAADRRYAQFAR